MAYLLQSGYDNFERNIGYKDLTWKNWSSVTEMYKEMQN